MVDLLEKEIESKATGSKRPASEEAGGQAKRPRTEVPRASWIEGSSLTAKRNDVGGGRGRGGGGGYRGGGAGYYNSGGGGRGFPPPVGVVEGEGSSRHMEDTRAD